MPTIETKLRKAIEARVDTLALASTYPIHWTDGPTYDPAPTSRYLRCTLTMNTASREGRVNSNLPATRRGVLQIDVMTPITVGKGTAIEQAGQVAQHFPVDLCMPFQGVSARVTEPPSVILPSFIDKHIQVPVQISFVCYA